MEGISDAVDSMLRLRESILVLSTVWAISGFILGSGTPPEIRIDVNKSDEEIRAALISHTPIDSATEQVLEFVHNHLYWEGAFASGVGIMPKPGITVAIGHKEGALWHEVVAATWKFDQDRHLRDIKIQHFNQEGSFDPRDVRTAPKVKVDVRQPEKAVRTKLLECTPIGSYEPRVMEFIQTQLFTQSGTSSGVALVSKPGIAVILGEYSDLTSQRVSVRANWVFKDGILTDLEIKRVKMDSNSLVHAR